MNVAALGDGSVLCAQRIRGTDAHGLQCVLDLASQRDWLA